MCCEILYFRNTFQYTFRPAKILKLLVCYNLANNPAYNHNQTRPYLVFHHDLLITKLHHIGYKIILMAYIVQKIDFMAFREYNYLNERWRWSNDEPHVKK
jgi:hypothetical protein